MARSQFNRVEQDVLSCMTIQFVFRYHLDTVVQQQGQLIGKRHALSKQVVALWKIHVAVRSLLPPSNRSAHTNTARALLPHQPLYGIASSVNFIEQLG